jgi:hypothetical protein
MPFMAGEGMAMDWIGDYSTVPNIVIGVNAPRMMREVQLYLKTKNSWTDKETDQRVVYMPNYYPQEYKTKKIDKKKPVIDIGCFGAIRPLKNHLLQAVAAIDFANQIGKKLRFHVNAGRIEMQGQPAINNLKGLFEQLADTGHELINHQWCPREDFLAICGQMDIGMQCNFSETFNIVSADLISQGVPIVASKEIPWAVDFCCADATDSKDMVKKLQCAYSLPWLNVKLNQLHLSHYTNKTSDTWYKYFK